MDERRAIKPLPARYLERVARWPVAVGAPVLFALLCASCSGDASPVGESSSVLHTEALVAAFAQTHHSEVGSPAGCEARIIGESTAKNASDVVYLELLCSSLVGHPPCPASDSTAFLAPAVARVANGGRVTAIAVDDENDAAYHQWVQDHFSARWRHVEDSGPKYGQLLAARLAKRYPCAPGVQPLPG